MMFNIPALGGTTAHPVAGTLLAVLLGPWAACIGVSAALAVQALFFGDGGVFAYGANCFTMAFVLPFVGYSVYQILAGRRSKTAPLRAIFAGVGAYIGLNAGAAVVAVILGIQPALFHEPNGHALFFPFGFRITLPAMLGTHLLIAGPAEAIVTVFVMRYLQAAGIPLFGVADFSSPGREGQVGSSASRRPASALWVGLLALIALSPLGLLAKGDAWGEWDKEGLAKQIEQVEGKGRGYVPTGVADREAHGYKGIHGLQDYASDRGGKGYIGAGVIGASVLIGLLALGGKAFLRPDESEAPEVTDSEGLQRASPSVALEDLPDWMKRPSNDGAPPKAS